MTANPDFNVTSLIDAEYLTNSIRRTYNGILIGTCYKRPTRGCHFVWPWVTKRNIQWHEASRGLSAIAELLLSCWILVIFRNILCVIHAFEWYLIILWLHKLHRKTCRALYIIVLNISNYRLFTFVVIVILLVCCLLSFFFVLMCILSSAGV